MARKRTKTIRVKTAPKRKTVNNEVSILGRALRALGSAGGATVGGLIGQPAAGAAAGSSLGATISRWLGSGDYSVSSNSIVKSSLRASTSIPMMHTSDQAVIVRHKEYIGVITSSTGFAIGYSLPINPGVSVTFPWLSAIAGNFSEYTIKGLVFHYVPTSGNAISGTNNALGSVMIHTTYRATESPPTSKHELLNEYWASEAMPSEAFCHPLECNPKENPFNVQYVRNGDLPVSESRLMYDLGNTYIATSGQQTAGIALGDLWVTYEVELRKPVLYSGLSTSDILQLTTSGGSRGTTGSGGVYFPSDGSVSTSGTLPLTITGRTLSFPPGTAGIFMIAVVIGSNGGLTNATVSGTSVLTNFTYTYSSEVYTTQTTSTGTNNSILLTTVTKVNKEATATINLPLLNYSAGGTDSTHVRVLRTSL